MLKWLCFVYGGEVLKKSAISKIVKNYLKTKYGVIDRQFKFKKMKQSKKSKM